MKNHSLIIYLALVVLASCDQGHKKGSFDVRYEKQPLKAFSDSITELPSGMAIELLAYSGGEVDKKGDGVDYCQFIGVDKTAGDTVRILATVINVEGAGEDGKGVLTPATMYDFDKGIRDATFKVPTEDDKRMIAMMPALQGGQPDAAKLSLVEKDTAVNEYVLIPQGEPFFSRHYKTVVGILSFKQQPW
jgi:hypothetical protein